MSMINLDPTKVISLLLGLSLMGWLTYHYNGIKDGLSQISGQTGSAVQVITAPDHAVGSSAPPALLLLTTDGLVAPLNGGTVPLTARVRDAQGQPVAGVEVRLQSDQGSVTPASAITDADGMVVATFTAGSAQGQARITAAVDGLQREAFVQIVKPDNAATAFSLNLEMGVSKLDPGQSLPIAATLRDASGQPVAGEVVSFFGSLGEVTPASAVSDAAGRVTFTYRAGSTPGGAMITALAGYASQSATLQIDEVVNQPEAELKVFLPWIDR